MSYNFYKKSHKTLIEYNKNPRIILIEKAFNLNLTS